MNQFTDFLKNQRSERLKGGGGGGGWAAQSLQFAQSASQSANLPTRGGEGGGARGLLRII